MSTQSPSIIFGLFLLTGCAAAYQLPPLTMQHPAHPEAIAVPEPLPSTTLAYGPADRPAPQPVSNMAQHQRPHGMHGSQRSAQAGQHTVEGEGTVIAVVPSSSQLVVDHKEIKGFMEAMTMGYHVDRPSLLEGINAGDTIRFTIDTQRKAIIKIVKLQQ